jgi:hypothetical protein
MRCSSKEPAGRTARRRDRARWTGAGHCGPPLRRRRVRPGRCAGCCVMMPAPLHGGKHDHCRRAGYTPSYIHPHRAIAPQAAQPAAMGGRLSGAAPRSSRLPSWRQFGKQTARVQTPRPRAPRVCRAVRGVAARWTGPDRRHDGRAVQLEAVIAAVVRRPVPGAPGPDGAALPGSHRADDRRIARAAAARRRALPRGDDRPLVDPRDGAAARLEGAQPASRGATPRPRRPCRDETRSSPCTNALQNW